MEAHRLRSKHGMTPAGASMEPHRLRSKHGTTPAEEQVGERRQHNSRDCRLPILILCREHEPRLDDGATALDPHFRNGAHLAVLNSHVRAQQLVPGVPVAELAPEATEAEGRLGAQRRRFEYAERRGCRRGYEVPHLHTARHRGQPVEYWGENGCFWSSLRCPVTAWTSTADAATTCTLSRGCHDIDARTHPANSV